jgi:hydroxyacylglutathione hydrolase
VAAGFATHAHYDHLLWHPGFGRAPRWASGRAAERAEALRLELVNGLGADWPTELAPLVGQVRPLEASIIPWSGQEAQIVVHDGHSTGHAAVWLAASRVLLAGDMLSDIELPLAQETGLHQYDEALSILLPYVRQAGVLVPGHGTVTTNPMDRWQADRRYLDDVLAGREVTDARLANAGMAAAHAANLAITHG